MEKWPPEVYIVGFGLAAIIAVLLLVFDDGGKTRDRISAAVRRWAEAGDDIMSRAEEHRASHNDLVHVSQNVTVPAPVSPAGVPVVPQTVDAMIEQLIHWPNPKQPGKLMSNNAIYAIVGGSRNEIMVKINDARARAAGEIPDTDAMNTSTPPVELRWKRQLAPGVIVREDAWQREWVCIGNKRIPIELYELNQDKLALEGEMQAA